MNGLILSQCVNTIYLFNRVFFDCLRAAITLQWLTEHTLIQHRSLVWNNLFFLMHYSICCVGEYCEDTKTAKESGFFFFLATELRSGVWQYNIDNCHYIFLFLTRVPASLQLEHAWTSLLFVILKSCSYSSLFLYFVPFLMGY